MGILDDTLKKVKDTAGAITSTVDEYKGLGKEYQAKANQVKPAAAAPATPAASKPAAAAAGKRYGDKAGEQRIDVKDMLKPLGSFKEGTSHVPRTGVYTLHEGEAVIPKEQNMNSKEAMAGITGKGKPEKKIHKIVTHKTDDGKLIHTHLHHHPSHHPEETHVSNNIDEAQAHMGAMEPQMSAQAPPMPEPGAGAGAAPTPGA